MNYVGLGGLAAEFVVGLVIFLFFAANKIIGNNPYLEKGTNQMEQRNVSVDAMDEIKE